MAASIIRVFPFFLYAEIALTRMTIAMDMSAAANRMFFLLFISLHICFDESLPMRSMSESRFLLPGSMARIMARIRPTQIPWERANQQQIPIISIRQIPVSAVFIIALILTVRSLSFHEVRHLGAAESAWQATVHGARHLDVAESACFDRNAWQLPFHVYMPC